MCAVLGYMSGVFLYLKHFQQPVMIYNTCTFKCFLVKSVLGVDIEVEIEPLHVAIYPSCEIDLLFTIKTSSNTFE